MPEYDGVELVQWAERYGHPEEWAKRAQAAWALAEDRFITLAWIVDRAKYLAEGAWNEEGTRLVGLQIAERAAAAMHTPSQDVTGICKDGSADDD